MQIYTIRTTNKIILGYIHHLFYLQYFPYNVLFTEWKNSSNDLSRNNLIYTTCSKPFKMEL